jgi:AraC-like DNA-binding protein
MSLIFNNPSGISQYYSPAKDSMTNGDSAVTYFQSKPAIELIETVHVIWELKTHKPLSKNFTLHALPDACINILFNLLEPDIAGITAIETTSVELNLGTDFHYVGIQFFPGVWNGDISEIQRDFVSKKYQGTLPLLETNRILLDTPFETKKNILNELVHTLLKNKTVIKNPVTSEIFKNIATIHSVSDMARRVHLSTRQIQRIIRQTTGLTPINLLKILKLQRAFQAHYSNSYVDQAHYIRSFKDATGYTPTSFQKKFNV